MVVESETKECGPAKMGFTDVKDYISFLQEQQILEQEEIKFISLLCHAMQALKPKYTCIGNDKGKFTEVLSEYSLGFLTLQYCIYTVPSISRDTK